MGESGKADPSTEALLKELSQENNFWKAKRDTLEKPKTEADRLAGNQELNEAVAENFGGHSTVALCYWGGGLSSPETGERRYIPSAIVVKESETLDVDTWTSAASRGATTPVHSSLVLPVAWLWDIFIGRGLGPFTRALLKEKHFSEQVWEGADWLESLEFERGKSGGRTSHADLAAHMLGPMVIDFWDLHRRRDNDITSEDIAQYPLNEQVLFSPHEFPNRDQPLFKPQAGAGGEQPPSLYDKMHNPSNLLPGFEGIFGEAAFGEVVGPLLPLKKEDELKIFGESRDKFASALAGGVRKYLAMLAARAGDGLLTPEVLRDAGFLGPSPSMGGRGTKKNAVLAAVEAVEKAQGRGQVDPLDPPESFWTSCLGGE